MRVEHIALQVADPIALADWYVKHLGFTIARKGTGPSLAHFMADGAGHTVFEFYHNQAAPVPDYPAMSTVTLHLAFHSDDLPSTRDQLLAAGATLVENVTTSAKGDQLAMLRDPWGIPLQLIKRAIPLL